MKNKTYLFLFILHLFFFQNLSLANSCRALFDTSHVQSKSTILQTANASAIDSLILNTKRVQIFETQKTEQPQSQLIFEKLDFDNSKEGALELTKLVLKNSSYVIEEKNILSKDKLTLGVALHDNSVVEVTYKSLSNLESQFVVDSIKIISPTGQTRFEASKILSPNQFKLKQNQFDLAQAFENKYIIKINLPLQIKGELLKEFNKMAQYFEYFSKEELRSLVQNSSLLKIKTLFRYRQAKAVFFNVIKKEPFKILIGTTVMLAVMNNNGFQKIQDKQIDKQTQNPTQIINQTSLEQNIQSENESGFKYIYQAIAQHKLKLRGQVLEHQMNELQSDVILSFNKTIKNKNTSVKSVQPFLSNDKDLWVIEKDSEFYFVFSEPSYDQNQVSIKYYYYKADVLKYRSLIEYFKSLQLYTKL